MMDPILFIHGYSAESSDDRFESIKNIYGNTNAKLNLPDALRTRLGAGGPEVFEIDLSRYISLDDGINLDDISRALQSALERDFRNLLRESFTAIVHSTGALVIRNWLSRYAKGPSSLRRIIYLAGANFGSGWAHVGKAKWAQWARHILTASPDVGLKLLDGLELGSNDTLDLHLSFLRKGRRMLQDFGVREAILIGSEPDPLAYRLRVPVPYAKEDSSDGVIRVAASNINFNHIVLGPDHDALDLNAEAVDAYIRDFRKRKDNLRPYYWITSISKPGDPERPMIPFAIPSEASHSGPDRGIVSGGAPRKQVLDLLQAALQTDPANWDSLLAIFDAETTRTFDIASRIPPPNVFQRQWYPDVRKQHDPHAQIVFRVRDQDGRPVEHLDIFLGSVNNGEGSIPFDALIEDKHCNGKDPNIWVYYLRTSAFKEQVGVNDKTYRLHPKWVRRASRIFDGWLEISAIEPATHRVRYLPLRYEFKRDELDLVLSDQMTTIVDVTLLRLPRPEVYQIVRDH